MLRTRFAQTGLAATLAIITTGTVAADGGDLMWEDRFDGPASKSDYGSDIVVAPDGSVYVTGLSFEEVSSNYYSPRYITIKYDATGVREWEQTYRVGSTAAAGASHVALHPDGGVVVTGSVSGSDDWGTVRYDASGARLWASVYQANSSYLTTPDDLVVDAAGNSYVTGNVGAAITFAGIVKHDTNGVQQWANPYTGIGLEGATSGGLAVSAAGDVYFAGAVVISGRASEAVLSRFDAAGTLIWERTFGHIARSAHDKFVDVELDPDGNIIAAGYVGRNTGDRQDVIVVKLDPAGNTIWERRYGITGETEAATCLAVDSTGAIVVAGYDETTPFSYDGLVLKYDSAGSLAWSHEYAGLGLDDDYFWDIDLSEHDEVFVVGQVRPFAGFDFYVTAKYTTTGDLEWDRQYGGPLQGESIAWAVATGNGAVHVTGDSADLTTGYDIATLRYDPGTGASASATLTDVSRTLGLYVSGGVPELLSSDDTYYMLQSGPGVDPTEPHPARADIGFDAGGFAAATLDITLEEKANIGGPTAVVLLHNWNTNEWDEIARHALSPTDQVFEMTGIPATDYINGSNRIEVRVRTFAVLVLDPTTRGLFSHDFVGVQIQE